MSSKKVSALKIEFFQTKVLERPTQYSFSPLILFPLDCQAPSQEIKDRLEEDERWIVREFPHRHGPEKDDPLLRVLPLCRPCGSFNHARKHVAGSNSSKVGQEGLDEPQVSRQEALLPTSRGDDRRSKV